MPVTRRAFLPSGLRLFLLGGASRHGIAITTRDGRRYVVTSRELVDGLAATIAARVG